VLGVCFSTCYPRRPPAPTRPPSRRTHSSSILAVAVDAALKHPLIALKS